MKKIVVTGAAGQIGSELIPELRKKYGDENVVAVGHKTPIPDDVKNAGPSDIFEVADYEQVEGVLARHRPDAMFHLSSVLSALAEEDRDSGFDANIKGLHNVLEASVRTGLKQLLIPSSIAAFGPDAPRIDTPDETTLRPNTLYGISKVFTELMGDYYDGKLGIDFRGARLPGVISWKVEPTAGTTDYAVAVFYGAIREKHYTCYLAPDTSLPMMYMPDTIQALITLAEADLAGALGKSHYNVNSMSFTPTEIFDVIKKRIPDLTIDYQVDPVRQAIAESWPDSMDDSNARADWGWKPTYGLEAMVDDMLVNLGMKLADEDS